MKWGKVVWCIVGPHATCLSIQLSFIIIVIGGSMYSSNCSSPKLDSLHTPCQQQTKKLFNQIINQPERCLHYPLLTAREPSVTDCL